MNELLLEWINEIGGMYAATYDGRTHKKLSRKCLRETIEVVPRTRHESKNIFLLLFYFCASSMNWSSFWVAQAEFYEKNKFIICENEAK